MSLSLSAPPPFRSMPPARQRGALLLASVALHAAVLIPIALNIVAPTQWQAADRTFEVWIDMTPRDLIKPPPRELPRPITPPRVQPVTEPEIIPPERVRELEQVQDKPLPKPLPEPEPVRPQQQTLNSQSQSRLDAINQQMPQLAAQPQPLPSESLDTNAPASPVTGLTAMPSVIMSRPHIEAIDGPSPARAINPLAGSASLPSVQNTSAAEASNQAGTDDIPLDMPIPRRARMTAEEEAALAAAAASGALDDAWVYQPRPGEQAGGWGAPPAGVSAGGAAGQAGGASSGLSAGTATFRGTPVDCTQPQLLSDIQKLSCDSAEARRIRSAIERGVRVMGTGDAQRDSRNAAEGNQRLNDYERRRQPMGSGLSQGSALGGSDRGEVLDEMSGTNREVQKTQDAMRRSNGLRPPANLPSDFN